MPDLDDQEASVFTHDGMEFQYVERGQSQGESIVLLHGFPQDAWTWQPTMELLASVGYRVLAFNQRGYSPGASPRSVWRYRLSELMSDATAFIRVVGEGPVHLVGHDLGGEIAWNIAAASPHLLRSLTIASTPHPRALTRAFLTSDQSLRSWYISFLQLPAIPEVVFRAHQGKFAVKLLQQTGLPLPFAEQYVGRLLETPSALDGAINWYRAFPLTPRLALATPLVRVPTMYIWSSGDSVVTRTGAVQTARYVTGSYDFKIIEDVSHWIPEEAPSQLAELVATQARTHGKVSKEP
jgi:pimeloyl-ACP methyl ester carboxylesterase